MINFIIVECLYFKFEILLIELYVLIDLKDKANI